MSSALQAEVIAPEIKNSWDSTGFLWVTGLFFGVLLIIGVANVFEKRHKKKLKGE